ncbi:cell wall protein, putative [Candida dubliniensis CD36]|uniref:Cell wall protein, putative n=1 Tax=Candida dubliniensis (strain CD36 / ATCC MYA-646 / CBS 7987 / NCPF 3949 / NRRL Y-17841) TaxID=573826 RepID=B9W9H3_CANDC|nr:cell wall protein, putative [Candida dubliniensis CD36]CAX45456.1 cell wall protein, putative [Candida dubliniensis CD36]
MKFSFATATLGLIAIAQATLTSYSGYSGYSGDDDDKFKHERNGIETLRGKFALAVKELSGYEHGKNKDRGLHIVYEIDDGQLQYGDRKDYIYYPFRNENNEEECEDEDDDDHKKKKRPHKYGGKSDDDDNKNWKRGDSDSDDNNDIRFLTIDYNDKYDFFTLTNTVLHDKRGATGEIAANHQFQFDKPPQKDALFDKGFTVVVKDGYYVLALKGNTKFWNSAVDDKGAFKIYNEKINEKSEPIELIILKVEKDDKKY